jgi:uncharacterized membrane protein
MQDLGTLGGFNLFSAATALNSDDVAGYCDSPDQTRIVPCLWLNSTAVVELPTLGGEDGYADAMNENGDAVGNSQTSSGATHCTFWPSGGGVVDCHGTDGQSSFGTDLNSAAQIVGYVATTNGFRAFVYLPWGRIDLPPLQGGTNSKAYGINDYGEIAGESYTPGGCPGCFLQQAATFWVNGQVINLQPRIANATGWSFTRALGINNDGLIVGLGTLNGQTHAFLLTPVDSPVTAWYKWKARIQRYYVNAYVRWQKQIRWCYYPPGLQASR